MCNFLRSYLHVHRYMHWFECSINIHRHGVSIGYKNGVLFRWMVAKPAFLLLGDRERRDGRVQLVASME
jgi:hypothetical protein